MRAVARQIPTILAVILILLCLEIHAQPDTYRQAYDAGYKDGSESGNSDRTNRRPFDFANKTSYQTGLHGFDSKAHDRDVYIVAFRRGFEDGYEDGYGLGRDHRNGSPQVAPSISTVNTATVAPKVSKLNLPKGTEFKVRLIETLSTQRNERGDEVRVEVVDEVYSDQSIAIPAGARIHGTIVHLKRAGRIRGRAEIDLHFDELELPDGTAVQINASVASIEDRADEEVEEGEGTLKSPGTKGEDVKQVGTATGIGALIGVLTGGGRGAKIGAAVGAAGGLAGVLATRGDDIVIYPETELVLVLEDELSLLGESSTSQRP